MLRRFLLLLKTDHLRKSISFLFEKDSVQNFMMTKIKYKWKLFELYFDVDWQENYEDFEQKSGPRLRDRMQKEVFVDYIWLNLYSTKLYNWKIYFLVCFFSPQYESFQHFYEGKMVNLQKLITHKMIVRLIPSLYYQF